MIMTPTSPSHAYIIDELNEKLVQAFAGRVRVRVQSPINVEDKTWMPVPNVTLLKPGKYRAEHPTPDDILLLIEVSSTTLKK